MYMYVLHRYWHLVRVVRHPCTLVGSHYEIKLQSSVPLPLLVLMNEQFGTDAQNSMKKPFHKKSNLFKIAPIISIEELSGTGT
jgi:hypothetical protein